MKSQKLTYKNSGVNIKNADKFVGFISNLTKKTKKSGDFKNIGGFGAISSIPKNLKSPHIVTSTDGVGTKIEIANILNKFDTIGIDLVAMSVNDLIVQGARPLFFLDYIAVQKINKIQIIKTSLLEFIILFSNTIIITLLISFTASYLVVQYIFNIEWHFDLFNIFLVYLLTGVFTIALIILDTYKNLSPKVYPIIRNN